MRPTGVVDPEVDVRETKNQIDDLMEEIRKRVEVEERTLVTTLTKKMAEDLTDYLLEYGFKVRYLHSEVDTLERIQIIRELRLGEFDILVGVNLLREGLDLPEVSLVAILDADKEGFLRGETSLIQTIGRAARNIRGKVIMYADKETAAMRTAIEETDRRRAIQVAYNEEHGITADDDPEGHLRHQRLPDAGVEGADRPRTRRRDTEGMTAEELRRTIVELEEEMLAAADDLRFEYAAKLRDEIKSLAARARGGRGKRLKAARLRSAVHRLAAPLDQDRPPHRARHEPRAARRRRPPSAAPTADFTMGWTQPPQIPSVGQQVTFTGTVSNWDTAEGTVTLELRRREPPPPGSRRRTPTPRRASSSSR